MRILFKKNKIRFEESTVEVKVKFLLPTLFVSFITLSAIWPSYSDLILLSTIAIGAGTMWAKSKLGNPSINITAKGIHLRRGKNIEKSFEILDIETLYIQDKNGKIEVWVNNKNNVAFNFYSYKKLNEFIEKTKYILRLNKDGSKKTSQGSIHKLVSNKIIEERKNHHSVSKSIHLESSKPKSEYFTLTKESKELTITNTNRFGSSGQNKLVVDKESNSLKLHLSQFIPNELSFYDIKDIRFDIHQNSTGEAYDLIIGQLIAITNSETEVIIYHCEAIEQNPLDFTSEEMKKDLIALKAMINFEIYTTIDKNTERLELDYLEENLEKRKDPLPNRDKDNSQIL